MTFAPLLARMRHVFFLLTRPMTLGVRGIVVDAQGRLFLVRHTYVPGWHLPGGGVESGESALTALARELEEEARVTIGGPPKLLGFYFNRKASRRDHVAAYIVTDFTVAGPRPPDREIAEAGFFPIGDLPPGTTAATHARLAEWRGQRPITDEW